MTQARSSSLLARMDEIRVDLQRLASDIEGQGASAERSQLAAELRSGDVTRIRQALIQLTST